MKKFVFSILTAFIGVSMHAGYGAIYSKALQQNKADAIEAQQEVKTDKQIIEGMILAAIDKEDIATAEALLRTNPILEDDVEEVEQARKALSESRRALEDALLQSATVQQRTLRAGAYHDDKIAKQVPFFDRMLGNISYEVHANKPEIVMANKNIAMLQRAQAYLDHTLKKHKEYVESEGKCPVCFDSAASTVRSHAKKSALQDEYFDVQSLKGDALQQDVSDKNMVSTCKSGHVMCAQCFYNPHLSACSICRQDLPYKQYDMCLQCGTVKDLGFTHCKSCKTVSVTCKTCKQTSCCNAQKQSVVEADHDAIKQQVEALVERCREEESDYRKAQEKERDALIEQYAQSHAQEIKKGANRLSAIAKRMKELVLPQEGQTIKGAMEMEALDKESNQLMAQLQQMQITKEVYTQQIKDPYNNRIKSFTENKNREEQAIKKMAKDATGFDLVVADASALMRELLREIFG